jgi:glycogen synthase
VKLREFTLAEAKRHMKTSSKPRMDQRTIAFVSFESEFAPCGGLAAVIRMLPPAMAAHERCLTITPYFRKITGKKTSNDEIRSIGKSVKIEFGGKSYKVELLEHLNGTSGYRHVLLKNDAFFGATTDPYVNDDPDQLLVDALFFSAAVPAALSALGIKSDIVLHLQDWETASVAHTSLMSEGIERAACLLTMNNPYDQPLTDSQANLIGAEILEGQTVLTRMLPLLQGPITTVSENFAVELRRDPLHTEVFADHLQPLFKLLGVVGVDNGLFGVDKFPYSPEAQAAAIGDDFRPIQAEKWDRRRRLGDVMFSYIENLKASSSEIWGSEIDLTDPAKPVFFLLGRDDPRQKGYGVAAAAIRNLPRGAAKYIFTPMPGAEGYNGLKFLRQLAEDRPGEVIVFPLRIEFEAFQALQQGSSFMVMCSLYEPFGGANEAYLAGMPVVARATGGLVQQVMPIGIDDLPEATRALVRKYHEHEAKPTGFLFREQAGPSDVADWQEIVDCKYLGESPVGDRVQCRIGINLFDRMVEAAGRTLSQAIQLYQNDQLAYSEMIFRGYEILSKFTWERAVDSYRQLYDDLSE